MLDDIKKSFNSILYERTTSPLFGTLIVSWVLWNWKIVYLTLFISEDKISGDKITYIITNYSDKNNLITYPLISSLLLITLIPFVSNGAYWLSLKFNKWKRDEKIKIEMKQLLTLEQSIELREQLSKQEEKFEKLLENKNLEIKQLSLQMEASNKKATEPEPNPARINEIYQKDLNELSERIKNSTEDMKQYDNVLFHIQNGYKITGTDTISFKFLALLESYEIIKNTGNGFYQLTEIGKKFHRQMNK